MGIAEATRSFCAVCGTEHRGPGGCPGDVRATGAERAVWKVQVDTPAGRQSIGVLLAPSFGQWRARIITYPNVLWSAPGGRGSLKFVGDTAAEAEAQAVCFVEEHVRAKRHPAPRPSASPSRTVHSAADSRKSRVLPVRFGPARASIRGLTLNLSSEGMFVRAATPEDGGRSLLIHLDLDGHTLPLRGLVMWSRERAEQARPAGMGILLANPPSIYQSYVASLP